MLDDGGLLMGLAVIVPILVAAVAALGAYVAAARKLSGKINTSEASQLWEESRAIRDDYREQLKVANGVIQDLRDRIKRLEEELRLLKRGVPVEPE